MSILECMTSVAPSCLNWMMCFLCHCHFTEFMANSLLHSNNIYYAELILCSFSGGNIRMVIVDAPSCHWWRWYKEINLKWQTRFHWRTTPQDKLPLPYDFKLQYEDPDLNNAPCNLTQIMDLPERATLKIIPLVVLKLTPLSSPTQESDSSTADTEILSSAELWPVTVACEDAQRRGLNAVHPEPISTAIVFEGSTVMDNIRDFSNTICLLFDVCPLLWLPETHERHLQIYSNSHAWIGKQNSPSKFAHCKKQTRGGGKVHWKILTQNNFPFSIQNKISEFSKCLKTFQTKIIR